ncbi:MAG: hypothetical protein JW855_05715 [Gammaproteobacteria bacterium]|nr:hypothetical protein [Gammaproteobacteria bacterium]
MRKSLFSVFIIITAVFLTSACGQSAPQKEKSDQATTNAEQFSQVNLIFLQSATAGELRESTLHEGYYQLTLYNVAPYITYFTQRPNRNSGIVPLQNFVKAWNVGPNSFQDNNPNAVIVAGQINDTINKNTPPLLAALSNPQYDMNKNVLQFLVKPLSTQKLLYKEITYQYVTIIIE